MPATVNIIRGRDFLQTTTEGDIDLQHSKQILIELLKHTVSPPDFDILIDLRRSQWKLNVMDVYEIANELNKSNELWKDKIGVLVLPGTDPDSTELLQVFTRARNLQVKVFTNYEDAIQWFFEPYRS